MALRRALTAQPPYRVTSPGRSLELETTAYLVRIGAAGGAAPSSNFIVAVDDFIRAAKAHGYWALRDVIGLFAVPDMATALLNLKSSSYPFTAGAGSPTLVPNKWISFNGATDYIRFGFIPSSYGGLYTLNSSNSSVWINSYSTTSYFFGNSNTRMGFATTAYGAHTFRSSSGTTSGLASTAFADRASGMLSLNRVSSTSQDFYHEGALNQSSAVTSTSLDTAAFLLGGGIAGGFCGCTIPYAAVGGALTAQQIQQERDDVAALLRALGALPSAAWLPIGAYAIDGSLVGGSQYTVQNAGQTWSLQRDGASYVRIQLNPGDKWSVDAANEPNATRSELACNNPFTNDQTYWVAFDFFIEPGVIPSIGTGQFLNFNQIHAKSGEAGALPSIAWQIIGANIVCTTTDGTNYAYRYTTPIVLGTWYRIVYSVYNDSTAGALSAWLNGVQIINNITGIPMGQAGDAPYVKFGLYGTATQVISPFAVRYANIVAGTASLASLVTSPGPLPALAA